MIQPEISFGTQLKAKQRLLNQIHLRIRMNIHWGFLCCELYNGEKYRLSKKFLRCVAIHSYKRKCFARAGKICSQKINLEFEKIS